MAADFVHLHLHTEYSLLDGASRAKEVAARAAEWDMPAVALTDHGNMYGVLPFYEACREKGVKPILGVEAYLVTDGSRHDRSRVRSDDGKGLCHFTLLCENETGYRNLLRMVSDSWLNGFYFKPRMDRELLAAHAEGLIAMSGCLGGEIPQAILAANLDKAARSALEFRDIFGPDNFFLEIQDHHTDEQTAANVGLRELWQRTGIPLVATNDVHYVEESDAEPQDLMLCIQTGCLHSDPNRMRMSSRELFMRSGQQMWDLFGELPEALTNTVAIADRCNVELALGKRHFPRFKRVPDGLAAGEYLRQLAEREFARFYRADYDEARQRLAYELAVIDEKGYSDYYLIVWDLIRAAKEKGIRIGPGRGSGAASMVAYVLGITELCPLRYGLLFERFLNPERPSPPDFDIDIPPERRDEVVAYTIGEYGTECTAKIITYGKMMAKAAINDVGRVLERPISEVRRLTELVIDKPGAKLADSMKEGMQLAQVVRDDPRSAELVGAAQRLEGLARHASVHPAAVVIAPDELVNHVPLATVGAGKEVVCQFDMHGVEEIGLLKMDFLGLRTMTVVDEACRLIAVNHDLPGFDVRQVPLDDQKTFDLISRGDVVGVFQLESGGFQRVCQLVKPDCIEDIVALVALYRPGPLDNIPKYANRKAGREPVTYLCPELEPILAETYGIIVYQEQVMRIAQVLGGFSLGDADVLRRAMGKKKAEDMAKAKAQFIEGCTRNGVALSVAEALAREFTDFASYAFNKAHSAAYGLVSYWTAWLKAHYPLEYLAAQLTSVQDDRTKVATLVSDTRAMGIEVSSPCVNTGSSGFSVADGAIVYGLAGIMGVPKRAAEAIVEERLAHGPYRDLFDLLERVDSKVLAKATVEKLVRAGACGGFANRATLLASYEEVYEAARISQRDSAAGQGSLFGDDDGGAVDIMAPPLRHQPELTTDELRALDKELLGLVVFEDPVADLRQQIRQLGISETAVLTSEVDLLPTGTVIILAALLDEARRLDTKGGKTYCRTVLTDTAGSVEAVLWPNTFENYGHLCGGTEVRVVQAKVERRAEDTPATLVLDKVLTPAKWHRARTRPPRPALLAERLQARRQAEDAALAAAAAAVEGDELGDAPDSPDNATSSAATANGSAATKTQPEPWPLLLVIDARDSDQLLRERLAALSGLLRRHSGSRPVDLHLAAGSDQRRLRLGTEVCVEVSPALGRAVEELGFRCSTGRA